MDRLLGEDMKLLKLCVPFIWFGLVHTYNIDLDHPVVFRGTSGTFFGFSVLEHFHDNTRWVLVGAPQANSTYSSSVLSPGAVYKCRIHSNPDKRCTELDLGRGNWQGKSCGKTCKENRDNEWMGVSLSRQEGGNGSILACAHRWKNIHYETEHILPHGACYIVPPNLSRNTKELLPCYQEYKKKYGEEHGSCQAGIAGYFTEDLIVMGAPGSYYWTGTVKVYSLKDGKYYHYEDSVIGSRHYRYLGYAVATGHFTQRSSLEIVGGAPQDGGIGKVYIFKIDIDKLSTISTIPGKEVGSYFGSSLCSVDLNSDGYSDLLVGAPMFTQIRDEGQVTVFINRGNAALEEQQLLNGDGIYNAHFGQCIGSLGDIDDDGFPDVAIGAPNENDFRGAVYIYHGDPNGLVSRYSMKLLAQNIDPELRMFGHSISGGVDMDGNGYKDVTIGAFMSDSVVLLRARPVITVQIAILLPESINITAPQCHDGYQPVNCFNVTTCFRFHGKQVPGEIELAYNLTADAVKKQKGLQTRVYIQASDPVSQVMENIKLSSNKESCKHYFVIVKREVKDVIAPIVFEVTYSLGKHIIGDQSVRELPALKPILRWKKGHKLAQRNQTVFERNCISDDCAADLQLQGRLFLSSFDGHKSFLALGAVKNISVNVTILNAGDDAYDTNVYFNFSQEIFFIKMWQKEEKGTNCELMETDFLKCSVGFPFMRWQSKYEFSMIFDTSHLFGEQENLEFIVTTQSGNVEHNETLHDNTLILTMPLKHEVDTAVTGSISPASFIYGDSVDASKFIQLEEMPCLFQPLNLTFQVINMGPSSAPGLAVQIMIPSKLFTNGADIFLIQGAVVSQEGGNCTHHQNLDPCFIPQDKENIFHTIFAFFTKSGRKVLDCDRPGRPCSIINCELNYIAKEETRNIDVYLLLNTEILKKDSASVIQFVTRAKAMVAEDRRTVEIAGGLSEDATVVFEALHNLEPRGYVVGWIIAISLFVGILIFLLLAVLLWKMGFFRRRYKEIIEAEKNRKDSEESWDWVQKDQ
ncbi:integrin alpha-9 isoform X1 [Leucoraja erinacea]|uniref:integrin alpha-9 isoform X1 n=1 Tax=Leucoraja erinaceus TaxID=7782 RepID=UPI0024558889|nr:integrin alpha-9 isoform X1 [Leucoraja erinacea]